MTTDEITAAANETFGDDLTAFTSFLRSAKAALDMNTLEAELAALESKAQKADARRRAEVDAKQAEIDALQKAIIDGLEVTPPAL